MPNSMPSPPVQALVLAGARAKGDPLANAHDVPSKALIKVAGRTMLGRVLDSLSASEKIAEINVIGLSEFRDAESSETWPSFTITAGAPGPAASVANALEQPSIKFPIIVTTCDHALLTSEILDNFIEQAQSSDADLTVLFAARHAIEAAYPNVARTYLTFGDGDVSSCNLFYLNKETARSVVQFWQTAEDDRKRPWRIATRFGLMAALRLLIRRPSLEDSFEIISKRLGVTIRPVISPFPDAAVDVDKASDLELVEQILSNRTSCPS